MQKNNIVVKRSTVKTMLVIVFIVALLLVISATAVLAKPQAVCTEVCVQYEQTNCIAYRLSDQLQAKFLNGNDVFRCPVVCVKTEMVCPQTCEVKVLPLPDEEAAGFLNEPGASMLPLGVFRITCWGYHEAKLAYFGLEGRTDLKVMCRTDDGGWTDTTNGMTLLEGGEVFGGNVEQHGVCGFFPK